ncbi:MAG: hypothetical protein HY403_09920, partial [Elusimicrobia bacterium]|nr:hypothetical protein [Elusimicrobiota bacterium]
GKVFFFEARADGKPARALHPLAALARPPEEVVMKLYGNADKDVKAPRRDRFPTLQSLEASEEAAAFATATVSPRGAAALIENGRRLEASERRRGWIEVKLNSFGFARDESGRLSELYRTKSEFEAQWKAFDNAARDLESARRDLEAAKAEEVALQGGDAAKLRLARARTINAAQAVGEAERILARSGSWTLHRSADLALGFDSQQRLVEVAAPGARGSGKAADLREAVAGGGPSARTLSGPLLAAVVDEDGRLVRGYSNAEEVDDAFKAWTMRSYRAGGDVIGADGDEALTKVRFKHYEEKVDGRDLPVLLGLPYLADRLGGAKSAEWKAKHWAYLPFNWVNIPLELVRGITSVPAEFAGRDPLQHHYLGRAAMYLTEGGATEHHGLARSLLGFVDVFNFMPDPVQRFFDPSQFPDVVRVDSALRPGEGLWSKDLRATVDGKDKDVHLGRQFLRREAAYAEQDLEAARLRTLARFRGGVEQVTLETRRGRAGWYQESTRSGGAVEDHDGDAVVSETPGHLFIDKIERRVSVYPGADAYARQAAAFDGYGERADERGRRIEADRAELESVLARAQAKLEGTLGERDRARAEQDALRAGWHGIARRIGEQLELEKRISSLKADLQALESKIAFGDRYLRLLDEARRNPPDPRPPFGPNPMFWVWLLALSFLGALASAWLWLRRPSFAL